MSYEALIEDVVAAQRDVLGNEAINIAQGVDDLDLREDGTVERVHGDGRRVVEDLVSAYVDDLGAAAKVTLQSVADRHADSVELPPSLQ